MVSDFLNVAEAAEIIGCTDSRVRQMLRNGILSGMKANERAWLIPSEEAKRVAKIEHTEGRPRKNKN